MFPNSSKAYIKKKRAEERGNIFQTSQQGLQLRRRFFPFLDQSYFCERRNLRQVVFHNFVTEDVPDAGDLTKGKSLDGFTKTAR